MNSKLSPALIFFAMIFLTSCTVITDSGNYIGRAIGLVPREDTYSKEEQNAEATALISPEQEYFIGRAVAARVLARFSSSTDQQQQTYLRKVGAALVNSGNVMQTFGGYHFMVIESDQLNAISAPGGYVFVTTGFLKQLKDEDQLASIVAHELGHVSKRHGIRMLQKSEEYTKFSALNLTAGNLNCVEALIQATAIFSELVDSLIDTLLESGYSQDLEFEADQEAALITQRTGYYNSAIFGALDILQEKEDSSSGGWFSTHPSIESRIDKLHVAGIADPTQTVDSNYQHRTERFHKVMATATH